MGEAIKKHILQLEFGALMISFRGMTTQILSKCTMRWCD